MTGPTTTAGSIVDRLWWTLPILVALVIVACTGEASLGPSSTAPVTPPSSRPSPAGPTTSSGVDQGVPLWQRRPTLPDVVTYRVDLPEHVRSDPLMVGETARLLDEGLLEADSPTRDAEAALGRVLFYDVNMSGGRSLSCASCHLQGNSFTDRTQFSLGTGGATTRRNSMSLVNLVFNENGRFFWDERVATLEEQAVDPFRDPIELGLPPAEVTDRILALDYYQPMFEEAFGPGAYQADEITMDRVALALAQFMRSMVSFGSPYDEGRVLVSSNLEDFPNFSDEENQGKRLFLTPVPEGGAGCAGCHSSEAFTTPPTGRGNNGLDPGDTSDLGVYEITGDESQRSSFRVSSLRNIEVTGPYMHDGRFRSLEEVVDHYSDHVADHPNLSILLRDLDGAPLRLNLAPEQRAAVVSFLLTLTDRDFLTDERFSDPFQ